MVRMIRPNCPEPKHPPGKPPGRPSHPSTENRFGGPVLKVQSPHGQSQQETLCECEDLLREIHHHAVQYADRVGKLAKLMANLSEDSWTEQQDQYLVTYWNTRTASQLAADLGKHPLEIKKRAGTLRRLRQIHKPKNHCRPWSEQQCNWLLDLRASGAVVSEIADVMGRRVSAICSQLALMNQPVPELGLCWL